MSKFREAFEGGRSAVRRRLSGVEILPDPAGQNSEQERLRAFAKWRFIITRGIVGWGVPMFLWLAVSNLSDDLKTARALHQPAFPHLFHSWVSAFCINAFFGLVVGFLAWRRVHSEVWPGAEPDPDSSITTLGALGPRS
jgi:hypothetical protein